MVRVVAFAPDLVPEFTEPSAGLWVAKLGPVLETLSLAVSASPAVALPATVGNGSVAVFEVMTASFSVPLVG